eukprot:5247551-Pleurochrysis_carterae.AAC.1
MKTLHFVVAQLMLSVLLRALAAHNIALPLPGAKCHSTAVDLLLRATKKRSLHGNESHSVDVSDADFADYSFVDDTSSEVSHQSAARSARQPKRGRPSSARTSSARCSGAGMASDASEDESLEARMRQVRAKHAATPAATGLSAAERDLQLREAEAARKLAHVEELERLVEAAKSRMEAAAQESAVDSHLQQAASDADFLHQRTQHVGVAGEQRVQQRVQQWVQQEVQQRVPLTAARMQEHQPAQEHQLAQEPAKLLEQQQQRCVGQHEENDDVCRELPFDDNVRFSSNYGESTRRGHGLREHQHRDAPPARGQQHAHVAQQQHVQPAAADAGRHHNVPRRHLDRDCSVDAYGKFLNERPTFLRGHGVGVRGVPQRLQPQQGYDEDHGRFHGHRQQAVHDTTDWHAHEVGDSHRQYDYGTPAVGAFRPQHSADRSRHHDQPAAHTVSYNTHALFHHASPPRRSQQQQMHSAPTPPFVRDGMELAALKARAAARRQADEERMAALEYKLSKYQH